MVELNNYTLIWITFDAQIYRIYDPYEQRKSQVKTSVERYIYSSIRIIQFHDKYFHMNISENSYGILIGDFYCNFRDSLVLIHIFVVGVAIGNGWVDPENMLDYGDLLYNIGMADAEERDYINGQNNLVKKAIGEERYLDAFKLEDPVMDGDRFPYPTYFFNISGSRY